jgi:hypothetical protein
MPTYSQNLPLIPTEYVPIDYSHDAQFQLAEAQAAATNIAKVKSRYEDLLGMDLTNDKSKTALSSFMKGAEEDLRKVSGMDMMVASNASDALNILKPLTDLDGQYGYIVVDNVFTKKYNSNKSLASAARIKGENYNQAADDYLDIQRKRFENTDDVNQWKYILSDSIDYTPYYDTQKELMDLVSKFKPDSIEADQTGGGRIVTTKDSSVYASRLQDYLEANLSDKYKNQMNLESKVNYGKQQLLSYDPTTKSYNGTKIYDYYNGILGEVKATKVNTYNQEKNSLEREVTLLGNTPDGIEKQKELKKRIGQIDGAIKNINGQTLDKSLFENPADYRKAEAIASNIVATKDLTDKALSLAHLDISVTQKADEAYWKKLSYDLDEKKFAYQITKDKEDREWDKQKELIKAGLKHINPQTGAVEDGGYFTPQPITDMSQEQQESGADRGLHKINGILDKVEGTLGSAGMDFIDSHFKVGFKDAKQAMEKEPTKFAGKTWGQVTSGPYASLGQSNSFNQFLLSSAQKMYGLGTAAVLKGKYVGGAKIIDMKDSGSTARITTDKGMYILDKKTNKVVDLKGNVVDNDFNKFTQEDLNKLPYDVVMELAIGSVNAPTARAALKTSLDAAEYTKADMQLQMAESNKAKLENRLRDALVGTAFEGLDIDITRINDKDYMAEKARLAKTNYINNLVGKNFDGNTVKRVYQDGGTWYAEVENSNGLFGRKGVTEMKLKDTPFYDTKYFSDPENSSFWGGEESNESVTQRMLNKVYENFDNNSSDLTPYEMEQRAAVPVLVPAKDRAGDKDLKEEWTAYANNNLNIVRGSSDPQKVIVGLVNDFPEAFIPIKDAKGYRFELNGAYVESVMTDVDKKRLFGRLDQVVGKSNNWFVGTFTDNITDAGEAVDALNEFASEKQPDLFRVSVPGYDDSQFRNDKSAASVLTGGGFTLKTNIPTGYENININPLSLSLTNFGAATLNDAKLDLKGQLIIPNIASDGSIQRDKSGEVKVYSKDASEFQYSNEQLLAKGSEIMLTVGSVANAWSAIIEKMNNPSPGVTYKYIKDVYDQALKEKDNLTLNNLKIVGITK